jgi:hypothetical protein
MFDSVIESTASPGEIRAHCELIHRLASPLAGQGKLVIASFGEDPDSPNPRTGSSGCPLPPVVVHVEIGDAESMIGTIARLTDRKHGNVYTPLAVFRSDLPVRKKGFERDIIAVLGLVADFDDGNAARWAERLPLAPNYVLETSGGRFQAFYFFDKPEAVNAAKPVAARLKIHAGCDHGTADLSHVWRIAGTSNWPNGKKVRAGRPPAPQTVRVVKPWQGDRVSLAGLAAVLAEPKADPKRTENIDEEAQAEPAAEDDPNRAGGADVSVGLILKLLPAKLRARITEPAGDRSKALFHVVRALIDRDLDDMTIERVIRAHPNGVGAKHVGRSDLDKEIARIRSKLSASAATPADTLSTLIDDFNSQYAVVNEAGQAVVYEQAIDPIRNRKVLVRIRFSDLKKFYQNRPVTVPIADGRSVTKSAAEWWLNDIRRRQYLGGVVFDPTGSAPKDCWNLWSGFSVEPASGDWHLMQDHIRKVICGGVIAHAEYLLNTIARMFQQPNKPAEVVVVLRGKKGAGKGVLLVCLVRAWGQHGLHISNAKHLVGNFNAHLRDCVMLFADEAFYANDRQHESVLKALVTEPTLPIEAKYQNLVEVVNMLHVYLASNSDWIVPASLEERRYFVLDVPDNRIGDRNYFSALYAEMEKGGLAAMIYDMLRRDIAGFEPRDVPNTAALIDQKLHSLDTLHKWWLSVLERGFVWKSRHGATVFTEWREFYTTELLSRSYLQWCRENRVSYPMSRVQLGKMMAEIYQPSRPRQDHPIYELDAIDAGWAADKTVEGFNRHSAVWQSHPHGFQVGALEEARVRFKEMCDVTTEWDGHN